jgi:hypothetical protein
MKATATFKPTKWDEKAYEQITPTQKMTKASVAMSFSGELDGEASVEWLMYYKYSDEQDQHNSSAIYTGLTRFTGKLNGKSGSFVMEEHGTFIAGAANSVLTILEGSGTDQLAGISGNAKSQAKADGASFELEYELNP